MDYDPQGSSLRWVRKRQPSQPPIHVIAAFEKDTRTTRAFQLRVPEQATHVVVDTPAALPAPGTAGDDARRGQDLVPVLPSDIDIHACSRCIRDLLLVAKIRREDNRIGVVANRVRRNTLIYQALIRFLHTLDIPIVATIRDSQNYVRAAELGVGVHEMKRYVAQEDVEQWLPLIEWLNAAGRRRARRGGPPAGEQETAAGLAVRHPPPLTAVRRMPESKPGDGACTAPEAPLRAARGGSGRYCGACRRRRAAVSRSDWSQVSRTWSAQFL